MEDPVLFIAKSFLHLDNIYISDKYRSILKKTSAFGNENSKSITTKENYNQNDHDSLLPPIILNTSQIFWTYKANMSYHNYLWKSSRPLTDNLVNTHAKEFHKKAQFHLHRLAEGAMKFCYSIKKNTLGCQPVTFNFSVDILSKAKLLNAATTTWFYPRLNLIHY